MDTFTLNGKSISIRYIETIRNVAPNVDCDVYVFPDINEIDLGIITIGAHAKTPAQRINSGQSTVEGYIDGNCSLFIMIAGKTVEYRCQNGSHFEYSVPIGAVMQWKNNSPTPAHVYELCTPPYQDGRYTNLPEDIC